jgi:methanethiol oxidase
MSIAQTRPDPTFYPSPRLAMEAPRETLAYVALLRPDKKEPDALGVVDLNPQSPLHGKMVSKMPFTHLGDELHHFGWSACSAALCPMSGHPFTERRYLIVPGIRSSWLYVVDTRPDPLKPHIVKEISPGELLHKTGYSRPHTVHCGPEGVYISTLGGGGEKGDQGVPGIFLLDCESFEIRGQWEMERGLQKMSYDFWWNIPHDYMVSSEWGLPPMFENGIVPDDLLSNRYGHQLHFWDLRARRNIQTIDLGANHQMALEVRPAHDPRRDHGFLGIVVDTTNLEGSIWTWWREGGKFHARKSATIPPEPADAADLPDALKPFGAVPPLVTDIDLSLDDRFLYVACWGTGELRQYDVGDPLEPELVGSLRIGGVAKHAAHAGGRPFTGGPQMIEISRDGRRVYFTNSLYSTWDDQFYPAGVNGQMAKADIAPDGKMALDPDFLLEFPEGFRAHQVRLEGGDCSTESFCFGSA